MNRSIMRTVWSKICTAILRGIVDRTADTESFPLLQVKWLESRVSADVEYKQPQGIFFLPKSDAEGLFLALGGDTSSGVLALAQSRDDSPGGGGISEGEGGLYYAGEFKVFLDSSGNVHLGSKSGSDYVALAAKVDTELNIIKSAIAGAGVSAGDGGATFKTNIGNALSTWPSSTAATKVKAT